MRGPVQARLFVGPRQDLARIDAVIEQVLDDGGASVFAGPGEAVLELDDCGGRLDQCRQD